MKCKYCNNNKEYKDKKCLSIHIRYSKQCYKKWQQQKFKFQSSRTKIKCQICGVMLRNISNTHLKKHNITQKQYKEIYKNAKIFSNGLLTIQKNRRQKTLKQKYSPRQLKYLRGKKSVKSKQKKYNKSYSQICKDIYQQNKQIFLKGIKRGAKKIKRRNKQLRKDKIKYQQRLNKIIKKRMKTNIKKYGVPFTQQLQETKKKQKDTLIKNYGSLRAAYDYVHNKAINSRIKKYNFAHYCPMYSKQSQNLFIQLQKNLINKKYNIFYATNGKNKTNEYIVKVKSNKCKLRYLDFYVKQLNKAIEFNEKYHKNKKQLKADKERKREIKKSIKGIKILNINEEEYLNNKIETINKCLKFLIQDK